MASIPCWPFPSASNGEGPTGSWTTPSASNSANQPWRSLASAMAMDFRPMSYAAPMVACSLPCSVAQSLALAITWSAKRRRLSIFVENASWSGPTT